MNIFCYKIGQVSITLFFFLVQFQFCWIIWEQRLEFFFKRAREDTGTETTRNLKTEKLNYNQVIKIWSHHFMGNRWGNSGNSVRLYFGGLQNHCRWWMQPWNWKMLTPWKESYDQPRQHIEKQRHYFANKGPSSQGYGFPSGHVWMWELDCEESWELKNRCFWTVVLEKTLESPLDCKEIQPVHSEGDQPWDFFWKEWC